MSTFPAPTISSGGLSIPNYQQLYNWLLGQFQSIYTQGVAIDISGSDAQLISIVELATADACAALQLEYNNRAPNFAIGAALDSLGSLIGIRRQVATFSSVQVTLTGTPGAVVTGGSVTDTTYGYTWTLPASVTIGDGGTVTVTATCTTAGAVSVGAGTVTGIASPTAGWTSVTNAAASVPGNPVEADSQFRARYAQSVALPSRTLLAGTYAALLALASGTRVNIDENTTSATNGNSTPGHSIQVAIYTTATNLAIATAIYNNKGIGCGTYGTTSQAVVDPNTQISYTIEFDLVSPTPIYVIVNAHLLPSGGTLSAAQVLAIQNSIIAYLNALPMGGVVSFGELVQAAASALNVNPESPAVSIRSPLYFGTSVGPSTSTDIALAFNQLATASVGTITVNSV